MGERGARHHMDLESLVSFDLQSNEMKKYS